MTEPHPPWTDGDGPWEPLVPRRDLEDARVEVERLRDAWALADADRYRVYRERDAAVAERDRALADLAEARAEASRLRAAAMWTVDRADAWVGDCCREMVDQQFCEQYGCGTLLELVEHLRAALLGRGAGRPNEEVPPG